MSETNNFYDIQLSLSLITTEEDKEEVLKQIEYAMNAACTELENNGISPTYKLGKLRQI